MGRAESSVNPERSLSQAGTGGEQGGFYNPDHTSAHTKKSEGAGPRVPESALQGREWTSAAASNA